MACNTVYPQRQLIKLISTTAPSLEESSKNACTHLNSLNLTFFFEAPGMMAEVNDGRQLTYVQLWRSVLCCIRPLTVNSFYFILVREPNAVCTYRKYQHSNTVHTSLTYALTLMRLVRTTKLNYTRTYSTSRTFPGRLAHIIPTDEWDGRIAFSPVPAQIDLIAIGDQL